MPFRAGLHWLVEVNVLNSNICILHFFLLYLEIEHVATVRNYCLIMTEVAYRIMFFSFSIICIPQVG